jgi:phage tail-like protein
MAQLSKQHLRYDPYKNFKFRVKFAISTNYVAGVTKMSALKRTTEIVEHREGGRSSMSRKLPSLRREGAAGEPVLPQHRGDA